jgi:hypothetical protein
MAVQWSVVVTSRSVEVGFWDKATFLHSDATAVAVLASKASATTSKETTRLSIAMGWLALSQFLEKWTRIFTRFRSPCLSCSSQPRSNEHEARVSPDAMMQRMLEWMRVLPAFSFFSLGGHRPHCHARRSRQLTSSPPQKDCPHLWQRSVATTARSTCGQ